MRVLPMKTKTVACLLLGGSLLLAACGNSSSHSSRPTTRSSSANRAPAATGLASQIRWLIASSAVLDLRDVAGASFVETYFDSPRTTVLLDGAESPFFSGWSAEFAVDTKNAAGFASLRKESRVANFVLYDDENWALTPKWQQLNPTGAVDLAARNASADHLGLITSPGVDLGVLMPGVEPAWDRFLGSNVLAASARVSAAVDIQAQSFEEYPARYADFVRSAVEVIRQANPNTVIYAGLSTNPRGAEVSSSQLLSDVEATYGEVQGYWLNIPGESSECPQCGTPRPAVAAALLKSLSSVPGS